MAYEDQTLDPFVNDGDEDIVETEEELGEDEVADDGEDDGLSDTDL
jgi:hypothetical protein